MRSRLLSDTRYRGLCKFESRLRPPTRHHIALRVAHFLSREGSGRGCDSRLDERKSGVDALVRSGLDK